jgi:hypothetical protein
MSELYDVESRIPSVLAQLQVKISISISPFGQLISMFFGMAQSIEGKPAVITALLKNSSGPSLHLVTQCAFYMGSALFTLFLPRTIKVTDGKDGFSAS